MSRSCLMFRDSGSVEQEVTPASGQHLVFWVGADFDYRERAYWWESAELRVFAVGEGRPRRLLWRGAWLKQRPRFKNEWKRVSLDLNAYAGTPVLLVFQVDIRPDGPVTWPGPLCLLSEPYLSSTEPAERPNVILWSIETTRRDHLSLYGYERPTTPFLEELAREAVVFEHPFAQCSWTKPSVASMLTGLYPSQHGVGCSLDRLADSHVTLAEILRAHGYGTVGFVAMSQVKPEFNYGQGFDHYAFTLGIPADTINEEILHYLDGQMRQPFFLFVHSLDPHGPYHAPGHFRDFFDAEYRGPLRRLEKLAPPEIRRGEPEVKTSRDREYVVARYDAELRYTDSAMRRFVEGLKARGLWDNTLMIITADHGEELHDHGSWGHSDDLFIENLSIPLLMKLPAQSLAGRRAEGLAGHIDLAPTILRAVGVEVPPEWPGVDLLSELATSGSTARRRHYAEYLPLRSRKQAKRHFSVITDRYQYIEAHYEEPRGQKQQYLFDLAADPTAQKDLAEQAGQVFTDFAEAMDRRYGHPGCTIVAKSALVQRAYRGTLRTDGCFEGVTPRGNEGDDLVDLSEDGKVLRFRFTVAHDEDALHFRAEPAHSSVTLEVESDGAEDPVLRIGRGAERAPIPFRAPEHRSPLDVDFGDEVTCEVGEGAALFMWRQEVYAPHEVEQIEPGRQTLRELRDLGYL